MGDAYGPLDQFGIALGFLSTSVVDIVLETNPYMAAHQGGESRQRELIWANGRT